jgi:hypothetical protein
MTVQEEVVVLREQVSERDLVKLADDLCFTLTDDTTRGYFVLATKGWVGPDGTQLVHVEDHTADVRWVRTTGPDRTRVAMMVRERLPYYDPLELLSAAEAEEAPSACIRIISRLAPHRPEACDPRFLAVWERMLAHTSKAVRRAAIRTAYGCRWPELRRLIEQRRTAEDELAVQLHQLLQHLEDAG